ncbi:MAG: helix-turn-helix domain-containing protein [Saprospiraceae bacterium]
MQPIVDQLVYFAYFQGLFLLGIYLFAKRQRGNINPWMVVFVACLVLGLTSRVMFMTGLFGDNYRLVVISELSTLLFGPTVYLFTRSSLHARAFQRSDLKHYIPAIIYNIGVIVTFVLPSDATLAARSESGLTFILILSFVGVCLSINVAYFVAAVRTFFSFRQNLPNAISFTIRSRFFAVFLGAVGLCMASWIVLYVAGIFGQPIFNRPSWSFVWLTLAIVVLFISYYGLTAPELYRIAPLVSEPTKYRQSRLTPAELDDFKERLDALMLAQKPFLNRKLVKAELASLMGMSNPDLARLLNERIGMNFFEYVNAFRIKEFIRLAQGPDADTLTLFGLAQEAGFNSKTTFNKAFKQLMGTSPSAYFSQQNDRP